MMVQPAPHTRFLTVPLEELEPDRAAGRLGKLSMSEADPAQGADEHIGHGGEPEPQLIGAHGRA